MKQKKQVFFLLAIFCLFNLSFCKDVFSGDILSEGVERYLKYSENLLKINQPIAAEMKLSEGILYFPRSYELYNARAYLRKNRLKNFNGALYDFSYAIKLAGNSVPKLYYRRGDVFYEKRMYSYAIKDYTKCLMFFPNYGKVYFKRANAYLKIGERMKAKKDFIKSMKVSPKYQDAAIRAIRENLL